MATFYMNVQDVPEAELHARMVENRCLRCRGPLDSCGDCAHDCLGQAHEVDAADLREAEYEAQFAGMPDTLEATQYEYARAELRREMGGEDDCPF